MNPSDNRSSHIVALCFSRIQAETEQNIYQALRIQMQEHGYHLLVFNTFSDLYTHDRYDIGEQSIFSLIPYERLECLIVVPEAIKQDDVLNTIISNAHAAHVPVITLDKPIEGCYNIQFSYANSMEQIVRHIVEHHGCTRVNFIAGIKGNSFSEERLDAYKKVLTENGIPIDERRIGYGDFWDVPTYAVIEDFLSSELEFPQAIICANDMMAIAACQKLAEKGFLIPEDVLVTGFDGIEAERYHTPRLTTAYMNISEAAEVVIQIIQNLSAKKDVERNHTVFHKITYSQSCGCRPKRVTNANEKVLTLYNQLSRVHSFEQEMSRMVSALSGTKQFSEAISKFHTYIDVPNWNMVWENVSVYISDNYLSSDVAEQNIGRFQPHSIPIVNKRHGEFVEQPEFNTADLAPDLDELLKTGEPLLFLPLHFQDVVLAYMVIGLPSQFTNYNLLYIYHMNLNHVMGILQSQHSLRTALQHLEEMYRRDYMTGLYNRRGFYSNIESMVSRAVQQKLSLVIFSIDLNGLKYINDTYGHQEGDFAIKTVAQAMTACAKPDTLCSRFGGDEFTVAGVSASPEKDGEDFCRRVEEFLNHVNNTSGKPYQLSASFGISFSLPADAVVLDVLIKQADDRMYAQKEQSRYHRGGPR